MAGLRFGRWSVISEAGRDLHGQATWLVRCECGTEKKVAGAKLRSGESTSCGCRKSDLARSATKHGASARGQMTPEYRCWQLMIDRCERPGNKSYPDYGGRGVTVCPAWRHDFMSFLAHVGLRPSPQHSIDRIRVDGGYEPGNVRWATKIEQMQNRRNTIRLTIDGVTLPMAEWARLKGMKYDTLRRRISVGMAPEMAVKWPPR